jgi:hypothetical protein
MVEAEIVSVTLPIAPVLTRLIASENFVAVLKKFHCCCMESFQNKSVISL